MILAKKREISFHGGEEAFLTPGEVVDEKDAEDIVKRADKTYSLCRKLVDEIDECR